MDNGCSAYQHGEAHQGGQLVGTDSDAAAAALALLGIALSLVQECTRLSVHAQREHLTRMLLW
jgi:hypothetical protein